MSAGLWNQWVVDASMFHDEEDEPWALCPVEGDSVIVGMTFVHWGDEPPEFPGGGTLVGVYHQDGHEAVEAFVAAHRERLDALFGRPLSAHGVSGREG